VISPKLVTVVGTDRRRSLYEINEIRLLSLAGVRWDGTAEGCAVPGAGADDWILAIRSDGQGTITYVFCRSEGGGWSSLGHLGNSSC
jgi:hypothetical protein